MTVATGISPISTQSSSRAASSNPLPDLELRLTPMIPQILMILSGAVLLVGVATFTPLATVHHTTGGVLMCLAAVGMFAGAHYLRGHLPVMGRMTQHQLIMPYGVVIKWSDIVVLDFAAFGRKRFVVFKLKKPLGKGKCFGGKYDHACRPFLQWNISEKVFVEECNKRMAAASARLAGGRPQA